MKTWRRRSISDEVFDANVYDVWHPIEGTEKKNHKCDDKHVWIHSSAIHTYVTIYGFNKIYPTQILNVCLNIASQTFSNEILRETKKNTEYVGKIT